VDLAGNFSAPLTRFYTYVISLPLTVHGAGEWPQYLAAVRAAAYSAKK